MGRLLAVLRGASAVGLGLNPVQRRFLPLLARRVAPRSRAIASFDQIGAIRRAAVPVAGRPVPVDVRMPAIRRGIHYSHGSRRLVPQSSGAIASPSGGVPPIRRHVAVYRPIENVSDLAVAHPATAVPRVGDSIPLVGRPVTQVRGAVTFVGHPVTLIRHPQALRPLLARRRRLRPARLDSTRHVVHAAIPLHRQLRAA